MIIPETYPYFRRHDRGQRYCAHGYESATYDRMAAIRSILALQPKTIIMQIWDRYMIWRTEGYDLSIGCYPKPDAKPEPPRYQG